MEYPSEEGLPYEPENLRQSHQKIHSLIEMNQAWILILMLNEAFNWLKRGSQTFLSQATANFSMPFLLCHDVKRKSLFVALNFVS